MDFQNFRKLLDCCKYRNLEINYNYYVKRLEMQGSRCVMYMLILLMVEMLTTSLVWSSSGVFYFMPFFLFYIRTPKALASHEKQQNNSFAQLAASDEVSVDGEEGLDSVMSSFVDLDTARQELEEFIPHVKNISDSSIKKMAGRDLMRFKEFKKQGELSEILLQ